MVSDHLMPGGNGMSFWCVREKSIPICSAFWSPVT